jgi:HSP20 family molecular chaperone IbpA
VAIRVLVVDDDAASREATSLCLEELGHSPDETNEHDQELKMSLLPRTRHALIDPAAWVPFRTPESELELRACEMDLGMGEIEGMYGAVPSVDLAESESEFTLTAEIPGVSPDEVGLEIDGRTLILHGKKWEDRERHTGDLRINERTYGTFERSLLVPRSVDTEGIEGEYMNGVLTVHLPKARESSGRKIAIRGGNSGA